MQQSYKQEDLFSRIEGTLNCVRNRYGVPGSVLKYLAVLSMLVDHTGASFVRKYTSLTAGSQTAQMRIFLKQLYFYMRRFGRLAFPIYCFLIVEGFLHTRNVKKYAFRLFLFALISEFPFDYCLHPNQPFMTKQNVFFTLFIGLMVLIGIRELYGRIPLQLILMITGMFAAKLLNSDYSYKGVFIIEMLYITRFSPLLQSGCGASFMQYYEKMPTPLAFIPIYFYNGKRGRQPKYFFYFFYPAHLMILGVLTNIILPRVL